jgi:hypothetical protein
MNARSGLVFAALATALACKRVPADVSVGEPVAPTSTPSVIVEKAAPLACTARTPAGAPLLIPDMAEWMIHVAPQSMLHSDMWRLFGANLGSGPEWTKLVDTLRRCSLELEDFDHLLIGLGDNDEFVAVAMGPGIARHDVVLCTIMEVQELVSQPEPARIESLASDPSLSIIELADGRVLLFSQDMLVLVTTGWRDAVTDLSSCRGTSAVRSSLADPLRGLDHDAPLWVAGRPSAQTLTTMASVGSSLGIDLSATSTLGASLRLDQGAAFSARLQMQDTMSASTAGTTLRSIVPLIASAVPPELNGAVSRILIEVHDDRVHLGFSLSPEELQYLAKL